MAGWDWCPRCRVIMAGWEEQRYKFFWNAGEKSFATFAGEGMWQR